MLDRTLQAAIEAAEETGPRGSEVYVNPRIAAAAEPEPEPEPAPEPPKPASDLTTPTGEPAEVPFEPQNPARLYGSMAGPFDAAEMAEKVLRGNGNRQYQGRGGIYVF